MGEFLVAIFVIVVAVFAFAAWLCARVIGAVVRAFASPAKPAAVVAARPSRPAALSEAPWRADVVQCTQSRCRAANAPHARFCRRCGRPVGAELARRSVPMRHVA